jgi:hypothetical protein
MATFTVTTTAGQDRAIDYFVAKGSAPNAAALVQGVTSQAIGELVQRAREQSGNDLGTAYQQADPEIQAQVRTLLGVVRV